MKKSFFLVLFVTSSVLSFAAVPQVPTYNEVDLSSIISINGVGFHGNNGLADLNGDGNLDIFIKGRDLNNGWATTLYYLTGDGYSFDKYHNIPDVDACSWERILVPIDYDADSNVDFILGGSWGSKLLQNDGKGNFTQIEKFSLNSEMSIDEADREKWYDGIFAIADFNLDGYTDIVCFNGNPRENQGIPVIYINNAGDGSFTRKEDSGLLAQRGGTLAVGDINNDGAPDLVVNGWIDNDRIRTYLGNGDGTFKAGNTDNFDFINRATENGQIILVDIDADGDLDLFVTGTSSAQNWANMADVYLNDGSGIFTLLSNTNFPGVQKSGADWCDLNADGYMDLVYAGEGNGKSYVIINRGNGSFEVKDDLIASHRGGAVVTVADFNSNGVADILLSGYQDGDNPKHFQAMNGICLNGINKAPSAPSGLFASEKNGKVTFSWIAGNDSKTPTAALRYNVYVKLNNGKIFSIVPADIATGKLRSIEVTTAIAALSYTLNIRLADVLEWGVQTIDGCKAASKFAVSSETSTLPDVDTDASKVILSNSLLSVGGSDATISVYTTNGTQVARFYAPANSTVDMNLPAGIYIVKVNKGENSKILRAVVR